MSKNELSSRIATVGIVEWSLRGAPPSSAKILYRLHDPGSSTLNRAGEAPVDLRKPGYRTLLLGLKQASDYRFQIEATRAGETCVSAQYALPTTGSFVDAPVIQREVARSDKREPGFIVTSSGTSLPPRAFIIDADGEIVWYVEGPQNPTRALMDYQGQNMWMVQLNLTNQVGEMRYVSMDGEQEHRDVPGTREGAPRLHGHARRPRCGTCLERSGDRSTERSLDSLTGRDGDRRFRDR